MKLKNAGAHRLRYTDYKGVERLEWITHVCSFNSEGTWINLTEVKIPEGKVAFIQYPKCKGDSWSDDSAHLKGYSCMCCGHEILLHTDTKLLEKGE